MRYFVPIKRESSRPPPLKKFPQNIIKIKKSFWKFFNFWGMVGNGVGVRVILFIPRTVSKHKIQLLPSKVCPFLYLLKERVANPHPQCDLTQNFLTNHIECQICKKMST